MRAGDRHTLHGSRHGVKRERERHIERARERARENEGGGIELLRDLTEIRSGTLLRNIVCSIRISFHSAKAERAREDADGAAERTTE